MPALKPATIGQKFLTDCGQNRPLTTTYLKTCAEFDEKLKYISNNMQDGPYSSDEWNEHMKKLKGLSES